jgi:hypothetical protein
MTTEEIREELAIAAVTLAVIGLALTVVWLTTGLTPFVMMRATCDFVMGALLTW